MSATPCGRISFVPYLADDFSVLILRRSWWRFARGKRCRIH